MNYWAPLYWVINVEQSSKSMEDPDAADDFMSHG